MSKKIKEYILNNYTELVSYEVKEATDYPYLEIVETIKEMEKEKLIKWKSDRGKFVIQKYPQNNEKVDQKKERKKEEIQISRNNNIKNEIEARNFESKKSQLEKFSKTLPKSTHLPSVRGGSHLFGVSVKATGDDLNRITQSVNDSLIEQNQNMISVFKEFKSVYDTFNALDKDYLQRILVNLAAAEEANKKAVRGLEENKRIIEKQKQVIEVLKKHKYELESLKHLREIDDLYDAYTAFKFYQEKNVKDLRSAQDLIEERLTTLRNEYNDFSRTQDERTAELQSVQENLEKISKNHEILKEKQEKQIGELQNNYLDTCQTLDGFYVKYDKFVEDQEKNVENLRSAQKLSEESLATFQNEKVAEFQSFQEQVAKEIKYLRGGVIVSMVFVIGLIVLIISGVL